ncbi:putative 28S rRNA (cytosine-C(5))-methyltransferase [Terramyces sp. JEL0728]|nr:putative 28S rRNA (cytosine-C(5))-methyltransferase [Terramyces sp. JEL0728]
MKKELKKQSVSEGNLHRPAIQPNDNRVQRKLNRNAISEPNLQKKHPLLDASDDRITHTYHELLFAAETLENIVNEGAFVGTVRSKFKWLAGEKDLEYVGKEMSDRVLKLVYGTMKYLPYIDLILVKTQFLVFNNQFLDSLGLAKVLIFDLMKHHFDFKYYPGINYGLPANLSPQELNYQTACIELVRDLDETLRSFQVKFSAAYARLRIELGARGDDPIEQMENILPEKVREKEIMAVDIPKTLRINRLKTGKKELTKKIKDLGYFVEMETLNSIPDEICNRHIDQLIYLDDDFDDLLVIPPSIYAEIKAGPLVTEGYLIFQDKASMYCPQQVAAYITKGMHILDARAGCGTKIAQLSALVGPTGKIFAFENRPGRLETLHMNLKLYGCTNVTIIEDEFSICDMHDPKFAKVELAVVEPVNSGTTIVDKLSYMLQEEEYPVDHLTQKDLYTLKRQQIALLKHAFRLPKVKNILYVTRSTHSEENEQVVEETLDRYGVEWRLVYVLPDIPTEKEKDDEIEECFTIRPSNNTGNGIFMANFQLKPPKEEEKEAHEKLSTRVSQLNINQIEEQPDLTITQRKRKSFVRKRGDKLHLQLPKLLKESVTRLSMPRALSKSLGGSKSILIEKQLQSVRHNPKPVSKEAPEKEIANNSAAGEPSLEGQDIGVFGVSLQKFYGPRTEALKAIEKLPREIPQKLRWVYPVYLLI